MPRDRSYIPLLTEWNPGTRQKRTHRKLDETRELIARLALTPVGEGLPNVVQSTGDFGALADQTITLNGDNFLNTSVQAHCTTDDGGVAEMLWTILVPGNSGNDYTVTLTDLLAGGVFTFTWVGTDLTIGYDSTAGAADGSDDLAAAVADYTTNPTVAGVLKVVDVGGAGALSAVAETAFTGGFGAGEFAVDVDGTAQPITEWTDTQIVTVADLSAYADGDIVPLLVIADGIEYPVPVKLTDPGSGSSFESGGAGYLYLTGIPVAAETFTITDGTTLETFTFEAAAAVDFDITIGADAQATAVNIVAEINADSALADAVIGFNNAANQAIVVIVPKDAVGATGNLVIAQPGGVTNMTDQDLQGGTADAFEGAFTGEYTVSAQDVLRWADAGPLANWVPVACCPYTDAPNLYGISADRAGNIIGLNGLDYRIEQAGVAGYYVLSLYDSLGLFNQNDIVRFIIGQ